MSAKRINYEKLESKNSKVLLFLGQLWYDIDTYFLRYRWYIKVSAFIHNVIQFGFNFINALPLLWKCRYWDNSAILFHMRYSISVLKKNIETYSPFDGTEKDIENMQKAINCLDELIELDYGFDLLTSEEKERAQRLWNELFQLMQNESENWWF